MKLSKTILATVALAGLATLGLGSTANAAVNNGDGTYTVEAGDSYLSISQQAGMSVAALEQANGREVGGYDLIYPGETVTTGNQVSQAQTVVPAANTQTYQAPATQTQQTQTYTQPAQTASVATTATSSDQAAKEWIANKESGGSYTARNGQYVGRYQLSASYLNGDYSAANQEQVANQYCSERYGSWSNAKNFWLSHHFW